MDNLQNKVDNIYVLINDYPIAITLAALLNRNKNNNKTSVYSRPKLKKADQLWVSVIKYGLANINPNKQLYLQHGIY